MFRKSAALTAAALLTLAVGACADADAEPDTAGTDAPEPISLVAAFYPLEFVASRVGGSAATVTGLAPPGVEAHDLELTPQQVAAVAEADLVIYLTDFQPAVDDAVDAHAGTALDAAEVVPLLDNPEYVSDDPDDDHGHDHDDDHGHSDEEEGDDHGHDHGDEDPHVWLDPTRLAAIADELAARLGAVDADRAEEYTANAAALRQELEALDAEFETGLANCERREIVVSHAAFGYLADRYDLEQIAIAGLTPEDEPTPQRLAQVIREAQEHGVTTIFFEVLVSDRVAQVIADEVGAETAVLDPIEGLAPGSTEDYMSLMRTNLDTLREALDCA